MKTILSSNRAVRNWCVLIFSLVVTGCSFYFSTTKDQIKTIPKPQSYERGKNLVFTICSGCHYDPKANRFIGKSLNDLPKIGGHLYSANLTHSKMYGRTDAYSDAELFYLLKTGISRSGKFMPYMMKPMMADEDVNDIIVFLRSDDPSLRASDTLVGQTHINFIGRTGLRFVMGPQPYNKGVQRIDENNSVAYGRYLVAIIGCYHCHSRKILGLNFLDAEKTKGYLQGGIKLKNPKGKRLYGPNLTPDKETGIGNFTEQDFEKAVREGIDPSGRPLSPPMDKFKSLTDEQVHAIYSYLKSIPAVHHYLKRRAS